MKRRQFLKKTALTAASAIAAPYILPAGTLFAPTGMRIANHVVYVMFAGGIRQQESVEQRYLAEQDGQSTTGNLMRNMLDGAAPTANLDLFGGQGMWDPISSQTLAQQGTLFQEVAYTTGPTGHFNAHTTSLTGNYTEAGLNLNVNPDFPTVFEYYRKHSDPAKSAINAWWVSEGLGPYPALNYSQHASYGAAYGANYLRPASLFRPGSAGLEQLGDAQAYQPDDVARISKIKSLLDKNFNLAGADLPGIQNTDENREQIKSFLLNTIDKVQNDNIELANPTNSLQQLTGDLMAFSGAWQVLNEFAPELLVVNSFNLDACHDSFSAYLRFLHYADYGVGWLWNKIQSHPVLQNDTIMICMPEHGRNSDPNNVVDNFGLRAFDHTGDDNSRRQFAMIIGPPDKVRQGQVLGSLGNPAAEAIDIIPTIGHILDFNDPISGLLPGRVLTEAFV